MFFSSEETRHFNLFQMVRYISKQVWGSQTNFFQFLIIRFGLQAFIERIGSIDTKKVSDLNHMSDRFGCSL